MATGGKGSSYLLNVGSLKLEPDDVRPRGVVVVGDKVVITDMNSYKVRVYSRHDGMLLSSSDKLESEPFGLCCVSDTELCAAMKDGRIAIISVQDSGLISRGKTFDLRPSFNCCHSVTSWNDTILVSGEKDGMICWYFVSLLDGLPYMLHKVCGGSFKKSFLTVKHDMIYISCNADYSDSGVYGFNLLNPSKLTCRYKKEGLTGIIVNDIGHLFVCNAWQSSIHHLTGKCQLVAIYKNDIPRDPFAIFWDSGVLYLTSWNNVITKFKTPQQGPAISAKAKIEVDRKDQKKSQPVLGETRASEQAKVPAKPEAKISPLRPVISVDPVEQLKQTFSETGIHGSLLGQLSKDLICNDWKFFFRELSVTDEEIKQIEFDNRHYSLREQIYQLLHFSNKKGILNKRSIIDALQSIDRVDLVTKYKLETFPDNLSSV